MSLFNSLPKHIHNWELVGKTYAPPTPILHEGEFVMFIGHPYILERRQAGTTSFLWKCSDTTCSTTHVEILLGAEVK